MTRRNIPLVITSAAIVAMIAAGLLAQRGPGRGRGGPGFQGGRQDPTFQTDHEVFHFLLDNGGKIRRQVKNLENGIETLTESDDPEIAAKIQEHVTAMYDRVEETRPIHMRDPLFRELFRHTDKIEMEAVDTDMGIRVVETSKDPYVAKLLQEHAKVVSLFIKNGRAEAQKNHKVPARTGTTAAEKEPLDAAGCCNEQAGCQGGKCTAETANSELQGRACCRAGVREAGCKCGECKADGQQATSLE